VAGDTLEFVLDPDETRAVLEADGTGVVPREDWELDVRGAVP